MPHLIIEFADEPAVADRIDALVDAVHRAAVETGLFDESHIRVRAIPVAHYRVAGKVDPFVHLQCRIHAGRTDEQKRRLSEAVLAVIREQGLPVKSLTVEVVEMERASYAKWVSEE